ncbi:MAG: histidinol-phosphatase HisJ family protein [Clostridiales bacterium]|jgi:histidinol-phosphatase (PHP family)|nr:histidinol-phosphatase HisJ family protein [Clostridiales bacterium]
MRIEKNQAGDYTMIRSNLHTHTTFCDGKNTPREMVEAAIKRGFHSLGFSDYGYVWFDKQSGSMSSESMLSYPYVIDGLKAEYSGVIDIFKGLENDSCQLHNPKSYDYTIGSVHYVVKDGVRYRVDHSPERLEDAIVKGFGGDSMLLALAYFESVAAFASTEHADIMGHFDLVRLYNHGNLYFDEYSETYRNAARQALQAVIRSGKYLEVNTGILFNELSGEPCPALFLLDYARQMNARVVVSSGAHSAKQLDFGFAEMEQLLWDAGFTEIYEFTKNGFAPVPLAAPQPQGQPAQKTPTAKEHTAKEHTAEEHTAEEPASEKSPPAKRGGFSRRRRQAAMAADEPIAAAEEEAGAQDAAAEEEAAQPGTFDSMDIEELAFEEEEDE